MKNKKNSLALVAIFKNEADILEEFIDHHLWQGVDRFYLTNNNSEDDYQSVIDKYKKYVTLFQNNSKSFDITDTKPDVQGVQLDEYNLAIKRVEEDWTLVCDLDEFFYTRKGMTFDKIFDQMNDEECSQLVIPQKSFNSNGLATQPKSLRKSFCSRRIQHIRSYFSIHKSIVRTKHWKKAAITAQQIEQGYTVLSDLDFAGKTTWFTRNPYFHALFIADNLEREPDRNFIRTWEGISNYRYLEEDFFEKCFVTSNHYMCQSYSRWRKNKMSKGWAVKPSVADGIRTKDSYYVNRWNSLHVAGRDKDRLNKRGALQMHPHVDWCINDYELKNLVEDHERQGK